MSAELHWRAYFFPQNKYFDFLFRTLYEFVPNMSVTQKSAAAGQHIFAISCEL